MIIITDYTLIRKEEFIFIVKSNRPEPPCPFCGGKLCYRDSRKRIRRKEGGQKEYLIIRRLRCEECGSLHNELPDCLVPYKHYEAETISGVLDGVVTPDDEDSEDYPCQETMRRWIRWFRHNQANMEGFLRKAGSSILGLGEGLLSANGSLADALRSRYGDWLERTLRIIYNSGGFLPAG